MKLDAARLIARLDELGRIGSADSGADEQGRTRLALTEEDRLARDLVSAWMRETGADVMSDAIGNLHCVLRGTGDEPPVMTGSHIDTVRRAGALDGCYGVVAGIEALDAISSTGAAPRRTLVVSAFTNEEGVRYMPDLLGSRVMTKEMSLDDALNIVSTDGQRLGEELRRIGYAGECAPWEWLPGAFVELHIEQGPILDAQNVAIGVVEGVQAYSWWNVSVSGRANHAGTTPMSMRLDAGTAAMELIRGVTERSARTLTPAVATVGTFSLEPGAINVVPARATFTLDLRDPHDCTLAQAEAALHEAVSAWREAGFEASATCTARNAAVRFSAALCERIEQAARARSLPTLRLVSGASHDAQMMARVCPTAMIFVPSREGISHNPREYTQPAHLEAGAEVLLDTLAQLVEAQETPPHITSTPASGARL
jgi:beta-ureidopropionase / N-carbamoyl-L-amino-acid hydrolase